MLSIPRAVVPAVGALLALSLAACGSQLDPDTVAQVNGTTIGSDGQVVGADGTTAGPDGSVPDAAGDTSGGSTSGDGGSTGSGGTGDGGTKGTGDNSATGGTVAGGCEGFKNQTGITDDTITIGNSSDISGPVPGLFEASQDAVRAYVAYYNATSSLCGHKLQLKTYDSRTDAAADQQAYTKACDETFAMIGSMSAFDSGGASTAQSCGLPDIRSASVTFDRQDCTTCYGAQSTVADEFQNAVPDFVKKNHPDAAAHAAMLYINAGAASENAKTQVAAMEKRGMKFDYVQGIDISEFNYSPYVQQMKDKGIRLVVYVGPYQNTERLLGAMKQQGLDPDVFLQDSTIYDQRFVEEAGADANGVFAYSTTALFDDSGVKEMQLYRSWLNQVKPGAVPNFYGLYAWSAARLFVEQAVALGGKLSRAPLVDALSRVEDWTGNGLHAPQQVGSKTTGDCQSILQLDDGTWRKVSPGNFMCAPLIDSGTGS